MNSVEQRDNFMFNAISRSIEFNSNGFKIMLNTPKSCKKVVISENMLENEIQNCDANCTDSECNEKRMTCESKCSNVQETINKNMVNNGNDNVNTNSEMNSEVGSVVKKSEVGNIVREGNGQKLKILIDKSKNLKILVDKSVVDNYMLKEKIGNELTDKLCESSGRSEIVNVQCVTLPKDTSNNNLILKPLESTRNYDNNKEAVEKYKSTVTKNATKFFNPLIGKDPKVIVRTFNINTKRHIPSDSVHKTGGIIFPSKYNYSNYNSVNSDTRNVVNSNLVANHVLNGESQNIILNNPQPIKLNLNSPQNEYLIVKAPWKGFKPKDPNTCTRCSRCPVKCDAQTQTDSCGPGNKNGVIIGRVDLDSSNGAVKFIKKDLKNVGKLVYVNRGKIVNGNSNNVNNYRKILPSSFKVVYHPDFINRIRKENLNISNISDSCSTGSLTNTADKNLRNASCLLNESANGSSEIVNSQMKMSTGNKHTHSESDSSENNFSKNVNHRDITDQHMPVVNENDVSSESCPEGNIVTNLETHNCDYNSKTSSVKTSTSRHISVISSCKDNLVEGSSCNTSLSNCYETLTAVNSLHGMGCHNLHELGNHNVDFENNTRTVISENCKNVEEICEDKGTEDSCSADQEKTHINQDKLSVMWAPSHGIMQKKPNCDEVRRNKLLRTMYEDWVNCQKEDEDGNLPLHEAVLANNIAAVIRQTIILKALEKDSTCKTVNHQNKEGDTALMIAAGLSDAKQDIVAKLVHTFRVDQTVRNKNTGDTALHIAARSGNIKSVMLLMSAEGAKEVVNLFNDDGLAPLHLAARHGHSDIIRELVDNEAEINLKDKRGGYTPLYHAWNGDHKDAYNVLIGLGADSSDAHFSDHLSIPGSDSRASEFVIIGKKRKQKLYTTSEKTKIPTNDKSSAVDRTSYSECIRKKRKM